MWGLIVKVVSVASVVLDTAVIINLIKGKSGKNGKKRDTFVGF